MCTLSALPVQVESRSKECAEKGDVYAANISQGRKDHQSRKDIQESGARGHKSNALSTPKCSMCCVYLRWCRKTEMIKRQICNEPAIIDMRAAEEVAEACACEL